MVQSNTESINSNNQELSLKELVLKLSRLWKYLLSKWKIIVIVGIIGGCLGLGYSLIRKTVYIAKLSFALEDDQNAGSGGLGAALGFASQFGIDFGGSGGGAFSGDNLLELIKSRSIVESTLLTTVTVDRKRQTLAHLYLTFNKLQEKPDFKGVDFVPNADKTKFTVRQDSILGTFYQALTKDNLLVDRVDKKLSIITIKVKSINQQFSKDFTEILAKTVSDFYIDTKTHKAVQNVKILQHQTDSVRKALNDALTGVASSVDVNPNPNPALQILKVPSQRRQVDVQANTAILTELVKNLEASKVALRRETPLIQIIDRPIIPLEQDKMGKLKGLVLGGIIASFLTVFFLVFKRIFKSILA